MLREVRLAPRMTSSNYARANAAALAALASMGLITTRVKHDVFGRYWRATAKGLKALHE